MNEIAVNEIIVLLLVLMLILLAWLAWREFTNNKKSNILGYTAFALMSIAALTLIYLELFDK